MTTLIEEQSTLTLPTLCPFEPIETVRSTRRMSSTALPAEADFILSALEAARAPVIDRRAVPRLVLRTVAELQLYSDRPGAEPWAIYVRDATTRGLGCISRRRLPLGNGGHLQIFGPNDEQLSIACTIRRCIETVNGWYQGSLSFNREQWAFDMSNTSDAD